MNTHICIATMGNQANIERLLSVFFWAGASKAETIHILSQVNPVKLRPKNGLIMEYTPNPLGCGGARQHMVDYLFARSLGKNDVVVFLDDDIEVLSPDWLEKLIAPLHEGYSLSGVEGRRLTKKLPKVDNKHFDYLSGGWLAAKGEVFTYKCRFDERYFPNYWEDADLGMQAKQHGFKMACVGDIGLRHLEKHGENGTLLAENRAKFYEKWGLE